MRLRKGSQNVWLKWEEWERHGTHGMLHPPPPANSSRGSASGCHRCILPWTAQRAAIGIWTHAHTQILQETGKPMETLCTRLWSGSMQQYALRSSSPCITQLQLMKFTVIVLWSAHMHLGRTGIIYGHYSRTMFGMYGLCYCGLVQKAEGMLPALLASVSSTGLSQTPPATCRAHQVQHAKVHTPPAPPAPAEAHPNFLALPSLRVQAISPQPEGWMGHDESTKGSARSSDCPLLHYRESKWMSLNDIESIVYLRWAWSNLNVPRLQRERDFVPTECTIAKFETRGPWGILDSLDSLDMDP